MTRKDVAVAVVLGAGALFVMAGTRRRAVARAGRGLIDYTRRVRERLPVTSQRRADVPRVDEVIEQTPRAQENRARLRRRRLQQRLEELRRRIESVREGAP